MAIEELWNDIISDLNDNPMELPTVPSNSREPLWFRCYVDNGLLYVENANNHRPSTQMSKKRKIIKRDFETVYSYYHRWANGERNVRQEVRLLSMNTAYIFGLIAHFEQR